MTRRTIIAVVSIVVLIGSTVSLVLLADNDEKGVPQTAEHSLSEARNPAVEARLEASERQLERKFGSADVSPAFPRDDVPNARMIERTDRVLRNATVKGVSLDGTRCEFIGQGLTRCATHADPKHPE